MQRHEVQLRGAESSGGGGWGRTASALPRGCVRVVWRRCPVPLSRQQACPTRATTRVAPTIQSTPTCREQRRRGRAGLVPLIRCSARNSLCGRGRKIRPTAR